MTTERDCVAIIPARAGSKRFPNKNRARISDLSLLERTCQTIEESGTCNRILLSTDDHELIRIAGDIPGIETYFRPANLATSSASTEDVLRHLILEANLHENWLVLTQLTSPLRTASDIRETVRKARLSLSQSAISVTRWRVPASGPYGSTSNSDELGDAHDPKWAQALKRSGSCWAINGAVYAFNAQKIIKEGCIYNESSAIHVMPLWRSIDVDYPEDLDIAARLYSTLGTEL